MSQETALINRLKAALKQQNAFEPLPFALRSLTQHVEKKSKIPATARVVKINIDDPKGQEVRVVPMPLSQLAFYARYCALTDNT